MSAKPRKRYGVGVRHMPGLPPLPPAAISSAAPPSPPLPGLIPPSHTCALLPGCRREEEMVLLVGWFALPGERVEWRSTRRGVYIATAGGGQGQRGKEAALLISSPLLALPRCRASLPPPGALFLCSHQCRAGQLPHAHDVWMRSGYSTMFWRRARNDGVKLINRAPAVRMDITASN
jgi:hypothetical protein